MSSVPCSRGSAASWRWLWCQEDPARVGVDMELDAIAATVIGGTPITGGHRNILGTVCGAFLLQLIIMMANMHNIPYAYSLMIKAGIILVALVFHNLWHR